MDFPHEFSTQARARIEAGRLKASRELADAQAHKPLDAWKSGARELDPLYRFHQWQANLRVLEVMNRTLRAASHPFVGSLEP